MKRYGSYTLGCFPPRAQLSKQLGHLSRAELVKTVSGAGHLCLPPGSGELPTLLSGC